MHIPTAGLIFEIQQYGAGPSCQDGDLAAIKFAYRTAINVASIMYDGRDSFFIHFIVSWSPSFCLGFGSKSRR